LPVAGTRTAAVNVPAPALRVAGFQVSITGRFWVSTGVLVTYLGLGHRVRFLVAASIVGFVPACSTALIPGAAEWFGGHVGSVLGQVGRVMFR
jgi:hypothetical protein